MTAPAWQPTDLNALAARCLGGDETAERALYDTTIRWVFRITARIVGHQDAEDVCQQVYLQVFAKLSQFVGHASFKTWLYRIAVNEALQHVRRRKRLVPLDYDPAAREIIEDESGARELLMQALATLDPDLRTVFWLRESEGLSYQEIAAIAQIPEGTVASRINRARAELQTSLRRAGWQPT